MKKTIALWFAVLLLLGAVWPASAANEDFKVRKVLTGMGTLVPVNKSTYLLAQQPSGTRWGVYKTDGTQVMDYLYNDLSYLDFDCFMAGKNEPQFTSKGKPVEPTVTSLNTHALVASDGTRITDFLYGFIKVYNPYWAACWILKKGTEEDNDYRYDSTHFYQIKQCDIYYLGNYAVTGSSKKSKPKLYASLSRKQFQTAQAHMHYLSIADRSGKVTVYNNQFEAVDVGATSVGSPVYRLINYSVCLPDGTVVMDGFSSVREAPVSTGAMLLVAAKRDFEGKTTTGVYSVKGKVLMPPTDLTVRSVSAQYVLLANEKGKLGLYSLGEKRMVLSCKYDNILRNTTGMDEYIADGYIVVELNGERWYVNAKNGKKVSQIQTDKLGFSALGAYYTYRQEKSTSIEVMSADKVRTVLVRTSLRTGRGDGHLLVYYKDRQYGLMDWHGNVILEYYINPIQLTADNKVVCNTIKWGYELLEISEP